MSSCNLCSNGQVLELSHCDCGLDTCPICNAESPIFTKTGIICSCVQMGSENVVSNMSMSDKIDEVLKNIKPPFGGAST